jgi:hypothetical protein
VLECLGSRGATYQEQDASIGGYKLRASHAQLGCVAGAASRGDDVRDEFRDACGAGRDVVRKQLKILQEGVGVMGEAHPIPPCCVVRQSLLEHTKKPIAVGIAVAMERSSPRSCCHFFREIRFWVEDTECSNSCKRERRWAGKHMVLATVSKIQPMPVFNVVHVASPFPIFFKEAGSCRYLESWASRGRITESKAWRSASLTWRRLFLLPRTSPRKSSTYTSQRPTGRW